MRPIPDDDGLVRLLRDAGVEAVVAYVFGSLARGGGHPGSDLDLAVLGARPLDPVRLFEAAQELASAIGRDVDLVDLAAASTVLRKEVYRTGRVILGAETSARREFEMRALADYARLNEERRPVLLALGAAVG